MKKYDVLILCRFFKPDKITAANLAYETAADFVKKGLKVRVVCGRTKMDDNDVKLLKKETIDGIDVRRLSYWQLPKSSKIGRIMSYLSFFFAIIFNWNLLRKTRCLLVYSDPPIMPIIAALNRKIFKVKFIFVSYDIFPDIPIATGHIKENSLICKAMIQTNNFVDKHVDKIIALSGEMKDYVLETRKYISEEKIDIIPNWANSQDSQLSNNVNEELLKLREKYKMIVLYSGNMGIAQDMDTILQSAEKLVDNPDILFVFTGNGQKSVQIKELVSTKNLKNVQMYDYLLGDDYTDMLKIADVHVISLIEGIAGKAVPSKTYSYMAIGRPLIAILPEYMDIAQDIIQNSLGIAVSSGNIVNVIDYIYYLLDEKDEITSTGQRVLNVFNEKYIRSINTKKYYEIVNEMLR